MMYLIGGAPRVGKSQFATRLITKRPMPLFSLDYLYNLRQIRDIPRFGQAPIIDKGRLFYPTLEELLVDIRRRSQHCVIEGEVILPEFIPKLAEQYDIRCCFLGLSHTTLDTIVRYGGHFNWPKWKLENGYADEVTDLAKRTIRNSRIIAAEARRYNLPYYDLAADYATVSQVALQDLLR